ncbi:MAG: heavy metal translocating P-type ATPase [Bacteroidia bacterium]
MVFPWQPLHNPYFQLVLSIPVYFVGLSFFGKSAWASIKGGVPNMDVLIAIGASSALFYSIYGTFAFAGTHQVHQYLFYETGATIITFVMLGNLIEKRSVKKTTTAIEALTKLQVNIAKKIIVKNATEIIEEIETKDLVISDLVQVNNGDSIPADGMIVSGSATIDESMLTGESVPVQKTTGNDVYAGTIITDGMIRFMVTKPIKQTVLSGIINLVKQAQTQKPKIQQLGDKVSAIFVPVVIVISILTFMVSYFWFDLSSAQSMLRAVAVLVISCPCAMGLATPTAVAVGIGKAARNGILIKGGSTLEEFAKTKTIIFDKTGTLTHGNFTIADFTTFNGIESDLKNIIYNLELHSSHPIAKSITINCKNWFKKQINFNNIYELKGEGIKAELLDGTKVLLASNKTNKYNNLGILFWLNQTCVAGFNIVDDLKEDALNVVEYFNKNHIKTLLVSGDEEKKVKDIAKKTNIIDYKFRQLPHEKLKLIEELAINGNLAMVGDGINDAPALTKAQTGISFSAATDIAKQSAQIILTRKELSALKYAHVISKQTYSTIKQNLFWAFFYNVLCIPIAAAGYLHPMLGALSMALSDVIVIGNSLRLGVRKIK